ncbi:uncharacterized protein LOC134795863 [Cydia splendana]|uniref:uncharacterized protein LOC134795863 n=1 Tax=Cydia splendana TaxID=1100963 RepID=UPI00300C1583
MTANKKETKKGYQPKTQALEDNELPSLLTFDPEEQKILWMNYFRDLLNCPTIHNTSVESENLHEPVSPPSFDEVTTAIMRLKNNKASSIDGLPSEVWKYGGSEVRLIAACFLAVAAAKPSVLAPVAAAYTAFPGPVAAAYTAPVAPAYTAAAYTAPAYTAAAYTAPAYTAPVAGYSPLAYSAYTNAYTAPLSAYSAYGYASPYSYYLRR